MRSEMKEVWPMKLTYFFLSCTGFGTATTKNQRILLNISLGVFIIMSIIAMLVVGGNFCYDIKTGSDSPKIVTALFPLVITSLTTFKLISFTLRRSSYERLLQTTREKLWSPSWTEYGKVVLEECGRQAQYFFFIFVIVGHFCGVTFVAEPIVLMRDNNITGPSDRRLPYEIRIGLPGHESPFYEIFFAIGAFGTLVVTILYFCFDYYLVLVNIFLVGQFHILKSRFEDIYRWEKALGSGIGINFALWQFKECVKQHQFLICLVREIESLYTIMNLAQVLLYSFIICLVGYQLLMATTVYPIIKYSSFLVGCLLQLFTITLTCHNIKIASQDLASGIYCSNWYCQNFSKEGRTLSRNFILVFMQTQYACCLTGWGFFPITLDTLKSIVTTAFSYLTLMRQSIE